MKTLTLLVAALASYLGLQALFLTRSVEGVVLGTVAVAASLYLANRLDCKDREENSSSFRGIEID